jgi:DNA-binding NarL/FixJ family response regulator
VVSLGRHHTEPMALVRVLLVDDQAEYREGLRATLSVVPDLAIVGEADDGVSARLLAMRLQPDVVLMDLRMPNMDGVQATEHVVREAPGCRVIALTTFADDELVFAALRAGASAYLLKGGDTETLVGTIRGTNGGAALSPPVTASVLAEFRRLSAIAPPSEPLSAPLSPREVEVVRLLAAGACNKDIARALGIAEGTVKNHVTNVFAKLGVDDRTQAALRARDLGLVR